MKENYKIRNK